MPILMRETVPAESTAGFAVSFLDDTGAAVTPGSVTWTLHNSRREVINGREGVVVTPNSTVTIVLSGADLRYEDGKLRYLLVEAVYDSTLGDDLPLRDEIVVTIEELV